jgi:ribonuclease J
MNTNLKLIFLGGLEEIGKNMMAVCFGEDIIIIDAGMMFPEEEMYGIDIVFPDISYLLENKEKIKGLILTHGHEDHIGAISYVIKNINVPIYGTDLTLGLAAEKLKEDKLLGNATLKQIKPAEIVSFGQISVEFIRVSHSISGGIALAIKTPVGTIVHSGDFRIDQTPVDGEMIDLNRFARLGDKGVLILLSDSTNADQVGFNLSESTVGESFDKIFYHAGGKRIIIASFASNVHRIQQAIDVAQKYQRKVCLMGRSMQIVARKAHDLGYLKYPENLMIRPEEVNNYKPEEMVFITTGTQGEPMSVLARLSLDEYKQISVGPDDLIIISAIPIPGNEKYVHRTINNLFKKGADVIYESESVIHVSGHASQEELKLLINLTKPRFFVPVHGEYRHLAQHAKLAEEVGIPRKRIVIAQNGDLLEYDGEKLKKTGQVPAESVLVDGLGEEDLDSLVLRDRKLLSSDGLVVVAMTVSKKDFEIITGPEFTSKGFFHFDNSESVITEATARIKQLLEHHKKSGLFDAAFFQAELKEELNKYFYSQTKRRPMILPVVMVI